MFGRTLYQFTVRNANPSLKNIDKVVLNSGVVQNFNSQQSSITTISVPNQKRVNTTSTYSTQTKKPFSITEKKIEDIKVSSKPTSPHLTVYKFPLAAVMSITHRATGVMLGLGFAGIASVALFAPHDLTYYIEVLKTQYPLMVYPARFAVAFPLIFHFSTGVRHIIWDETVKGITLEEVHSTGLIILGAVGALSLFFTFFSFN